MIRRDIGDRGMIAYRDTLWEMSIVGSKLSSNEFNINSLDFSDRAGDQFVRIHGDTPLVYRKMSRSKKRGGYRNRYRISASLSPYYIKIFHIFFYS